MKNNKTRFNLLLGGVVLVFCFFTANTNIYAQKMLSESETRLVEEAQSELTRAISDPTMEQSERLRLVERSAKTLKEYGQEPQFPSGTIPLKILMESNYNQSRREFEDANNLYQLLSSKVLDQQLRIINTLQISVAEEQIKIMIPGLPAPYELSKELISTFLKWDIREGVNSGTYGDAQSLVKHFNKLANTKELIKVLESLRNGQRESMQNLHRDLNMVAPLETQLRKKYEMAAATTFTTKGYEGAKLYSAAPGAAVNATAISESNPQLLPGNINFIDLELTGYGLPDYSGLDFSRWHSGFFIGHISIGKNFYNGRYANSAEFNGGGASPTSSNFSFTSSWHGDDVLYDHGCSYSAKGMLVVKGSYSNGVITKLTLTQTYIRNDKESSESVQFIYNDEKFIELVNIPIKKYPDELNKKNKTNYLFYAEIEGEEVKNKVKVCREVESVKYNNGDQNKHSESELLPQSLSGAGANNKLHIYFGQFKKFVRDW